MKKQKSGKKSLKWILLSVCVAILAMAGVTAALLLGAEAPTEQPAVQVQPELTVSDKLYLNVERSRYYQKDFLRRVDDDGLITFLLAVDGEQQRFQVADVTLAQYMDTLEVMGLTFDQEGIIVDARPVEEFTGGYAVKRYYVESIAGDQVLCGNSPLYDGYTKAIQIAEDTPIYFGLEDEILAGAPTTLQVDDEITAIQDQEGKLLAVYTNAYQQPGDIYWNVERMYNSVSAMTSRTTNALGEYEFLLAVNGEQVTLRTRDQAIATAMDAVAGKSFGLSFDENGEITEVVEAKVATGGGYFSSWYHITAIGNDGRTLYTKKIADGSDKGQEQVGIMSRQCKIFDVSTSAEYVGVPLEMEDLQPGDQIHGLTDARGQVCVIFVVNRRVDSPLYWNVERKWDSESASSSRECDGNGYYWFKLAVNGQQITVKCKDKALVDYMDGQAAKHFGLKLEGNEVVQVYSPNQCTGGSYFASWYDVTSIEDGVVTATRLIEGDKNYGKQVSAKMAKDCKVYNVSSATNYFVGEETTLRVGDRIHGQTNYMGELVVIYVVGNRTVDAKLYWNVERMWDSTAGKSTRQPNEEGWYEFLLAVEGKQVTLKTKDTELVEQMDAKADRYFGLQLQGDVITQYYHPDAVCGGSYFASWCDVQTIGADGTVMAERTIAGSSNFGTQYTAKMAKDCKVYNVSSVTNDFVGEETTLRVGDRIQGHKNKQGELVIIYVVGNRTVDAKLYWNVERMWDSTAGKSTRQPNEEGWYEFLLAVEGKQVTLKTKDTELVEQMDAKADRYFGLQLQGDVITQYYHPDAVCGGSYFASWYDVTSIEDGMVTAARLIEGDPNYGTQASAKMASGCKVYNVSTNGNVEEFVGEVAALQIGDRIQGHKNRQGELVIIYIVSRFGMTETEHTCTHVSENVQWYSWNGKADISQSGHYVLTRDITLTKTMSIADDIQVTLCLNGHTVTGAEGLSALTVRYGAKLTICDHKLADGSYAGGIKTSFAGNAGGVFYAYDGAEVHICGGNFENTGSAVQGGIAGIGNKGAGCTLNIYDGLFKGADATSRGGLFVAFEAATIHIYGGTFEGGSAPNGGQLYLCKKAEVSISGGTFKGGNATSGGAVYLQNGAQATVSGGTITDFTATGSGGCFFVEPGAALNISGGTISGGTASSGGNIFAGGGANETEAPAAYAQVNISGGTISGGTATSGNGGNILMQNAARGILSDGTVQDGTASGSAGNLCITCFDKDQYSVNTFEITGGAITGGTAAKQGGGIWIYKSTLNMTGGTLRGGTATTGNALYMVGASTQVILDGTAQVKSGTDGKTNCLWLDSGVLTLGGSCQVDGLRVRGKDRFEIAEAGLNEDARIGIEMAAPAVFLSDQEALLSNFIPADPWYSVSAENGHLRLNLVASDHMHCLCCGGSEGVGTHSCEQTPFLPWDQADSLPTEGNYYLTTDVTLSAKVDPAVSGTTLNLCLNGHTVTGPASTNTFIVRTALNITDCSPEEQWGAIVAQADIEGSVFYMYDHNGGSQVNLFAGILEHGLDSSTKNGGIAYMGNQNKGTTVFNMYGGEIRGANVGSSCGGALYMQDQATFNLYGGKITGGSARSGGNVYTRSAAARINIHGGTVSDGTAVFGGNIYIITSGAKLTMTGGQILDGSASGSGCAGSNLLVSGAASMEMTGGTIGAGKTKDVASFQLGNSKLILSGTPVIYGHEGQNLYLADSRGSLELGQLQTGAQIGIAMATPGTFATGTAQQAAFFQSDMADYNVLQSVSSIMLAAADAHIHCLCNDQHAGVGTHECAVQVWQPWERTDSLPTSGYYYLTQDVTVTGSVTIPQGATLNLCLNGHTVTGPESAITFIIRTGLNITDCSPEEQWGAVVARANTTGGVFYMYDHNGGSEVNLFAGILKHSRTSITNNGGIAYMGNQNKGTTVFNMYGGKLQGTSTSASGGTLFMQDQATFNLYGGTVTGGSARSGGNIYTKSAAARINIHGGTVSDGTAVFGGNIYIITSGAKLTMTGGQILDGSASGSGCAGSNLLVSGAASMEMTGGTIGAGKTTAVASFQLGNSKLILSGTSVIYGHEGQNLYLADSRGSLELGQLQTGARIGISMATPGTFGTVDAAAWFVSDDTAYEVVFESGELKLKARAD